MAGPTAAGQTRSQRPGEGVGAQQRDFGVPSKGTFGCPAKGLLGAQQRDSLATRQVPRKGLGAQKGSFRKQIRDVKVGRGDTTLVRNSASLVCVLSDLLDHLKQSIGDGHAI